MGPYSTPERFSVVQGGFIKSRAAHPRRWGHGYKGLMHYSTNRSLPELKATFRELIYFIIKVQKD